MVDVVRRVQSCRLGRDLLRRAFKTCSLPNSALDDGMFNA